MTRLRLDWLERTEQMTIRDNLTEWTFGLTDEIPDNAKIAWGARAVADKGGGFSLLYDRCNFIGDESLRGEFNLDLNRAIARGQENCKKLRLGWNPLDLDPDQFVDYWNSSMSEDIEPFKEAAARVGLDLSNLDPKQIYFEVKKEKRVLSEYYRDVEDSYSEVPDPPSSCKGHDDDWDDFELEEPCKQRFVKRSNVWDGCILIDDAWECENCGYQHFFDIDSPSAPDAPFFDAFSGIVGYQYPKMSDNEAGTFVLYEDESIVLKGDTNGSFGYIYLIAYPA